MTWKATALDALNEREKAILQRLSAGLSDQQIADELLPLREYRQVVQPPDVQQTGG